MNDHLKDAAVAASVSDGQLLETYGRIDGAVELTREQQVIEDEIGRRGLKANEAAA
ncbi:hypothetical protein SAMN05518849_13715 [Sphingobium sp. AP50]|uniref:hypothetical protein n=1 Tax=Sphingobium sp. AP50 TaxID=1884369 RepID=UPI0008AF86B4|nr:hypothetical protein [Sphingobium sp. AP50]SEK05557.1 hypothetical protein SAMN05518849_13715 [Sphingobium sp. AP50]